MLEEGLTAHAPAAQPCGDPLTLLFACGEGIGEMNLTGAIQIMPRNSLSCDLLCLAQKEQFNA
jgi:hypothetical protein